MNRRILRIGAAALAISILTACGGGGGGGGGGGDGGSYPATMTTPQFIDMMASKTWETTCYKNPDYPNALSPKEGPYQKDLGTLKRTGAQTLEERSIEMHYNNATCTGAPIYLDAGDKADGDPETFSVGTPVKNSQGKWQAVLTDSDKDDTLVVLTSLTTMEAQWEFQSEIVTRRSKASSENFETLLQKAKAQKK